MATDRDMQLAQLTVQAVQALCQLAELHDAKKVSDEEFKALKARLLTVAK